jgi:hypothetical protein
MSMTETKGYMARCIDMTSNEELVAHEVEFDRKDSGVWVHHVVRILATDPLDAINAIKRINKDG